MEQSLVTCSFCSLCDLVGLAGNIISLLLGLALASTLLFLVISGISWIFSLGNRNRINFSKRGFKYSIIGLAICIIGWLLVHGLYQVIGYKGSNWWRINCQEETEGETPVIPGLKSTRNPSEFTRIQPLRGLSEIMTGENKIGVLDLRNLDRENAKLDIGLLQPGEKIKFLAGYGDMNQNDLENMINLLSGKLLENGQNNVALNELLNNTQEVANLDMYDGGPAVVGKDDYSGLTAGDPTEYEFGDTFNKLIQALLKKTVERVIVFKAGSSELNWSSCVDSGGDWIEFKNECTARNQICGKQSIKCSGVSNPTSGCQCPAGSCLVNGKCVENNLVSNQGLNAQGSKDEDGDGILNDSDKCLATPKGQTINKDPLSENYGCSCSQINLAPRNCPSTRCEGTNLVQYPPSGKDQCASGTVTQYSCNPASSAYNVTCDSVRNLNDFYQKEDLIRQAQNQNQNSNQQIYDQLNDWLNQGKASQNGQNSGSNGNNSGSGSGNTGSGSGRSGSNTGGNTGNTGTGGNQGTGNQGTGNNSGCSDCNQGSNNTGSNNTGTTDTGTSPTDSSGSNTYTPSSDLGKDGNFNELAKCMGFKDGEIPKNGAIIGFYKDNSHQTMDIWYLDPKTGKAVGNNGDSGMPLRTYPQGNGGGVGKNGIYSVQVQPHYSDDGDTRESPLTMRSDMRMTYNGSSPSRTNRINIHPGEHTAGCLGTGGRKQQDNFMRHPWKTVRGSENPPDDDCSQAKGACYNKHRRNDTILFSTMPYGTCQGDPYKAIATLQSMKEYQGYDPQMIKYGDKK